VADPFSQVFTGLWQLVEEHAGLSQLVRIGNRIKLDHPRDRDPYKSAVQVADLPELLLVPEGIASMTYYTSSCHSRVLRRYAWMYSTGDLRVNHLLNPVTWELVCAMSRAPDVLPALKWRDKNFVKRLDVLDSAEGVVDPERNRNIRGWSSVFRLEVEMFFENEDLRTWQS
jgi:hypothetical protein